MWEGGVKNCLKLRDDICGRPLRVLILSIVIDNCCDKIVLFLLSQALATMGVTTNSKMKKADLVDLVYKNFKD